MTRNAMSSWVFFSIFGDGGSRKAWPGVYGRNVLLTFEEDHSRGPLSILLLRRAQAPAALPRQSTSTTVLITMRRSASMAAGEMASEQSRDEPSKSCLLYTSDAADDLLCVDLGGRRIIKK